MDSILYKLRDKAAWQEYYEYKTGKGHLPERERRELADFIERRGYRHAAENITGCTPLSTPRKKLINKIGGKKRVVYSFGEEENRVLKLLAYLLYRYDGKLSPGCYSFRKGQSVQTAIHKITGTPGISDMWAYKLDISNYFGSISVPKLLPILQEIIADDPLLYGFFCTVLTADKALYEDKIINENRGVMAGTPISPFLANVYLRELDSYFTGRGILYARYSDDIIVFAGTREEIYEYRDILGDFLREYGLSVNTDKECVSPPGQPWEYLGAEYANGRMDLSRATRHKLKGKIRRKARSLYRWKLRKNASGEQAMRVMIRIFNRKFYERGNPHSLTWSRWFFPLVTEKDGFAEMDAYLQQYIRYIATGCHGKKNYKITYEQLKALGYRSLVNEYYKFKKNYSDRTVI